MAKNGLVAGAPSALTCTYGGSTSITIYDVTGVDYSFNGSTFQNQSDDKLWAMNGGTHELGVSMTITTYDQTAAEALAGGVTIQGLTAVFAGRGSTSGNITVSLAKGAVESVAISGAHGNAPKQATINITGFSSDGSTNPLNLSA